jgi:DNA (cytosine-5)-methyltransferase 1
MTIGSLFSGIGGLELGLERAGLGPTLFQVEIDPFCRKVLEKHWPSALRFEDVKQVGSSNLPRVDILCGGFPCQDVSSAGKAAGLKKGTRSGLWYEYLRIAQELKPAFVVVENVASGAARWLCEVRGNLHAIGYRTRAVALSARDVGAPHLRKRIFIVANAVGSLGENRHQFESIRAIQKQRSNRDERMAFSWGLPWPQYRGMAHGVPRRLDIARITALGNAVVPQCAEVIGRIIAEGNT